MAQRLRLDQLLVERQLAPSRERAQALILAGKVLVNAQRIDKPGKSVDPLSNLQVLGQDHPYVSRGGLKLAGALTAFELDVAEKIAIDVGASTGGFTDCLLQQGAQRVYAIDVGYGQLAWPLRQDPRVVSMERTNIRHLSATALPDPIALAVVDASFISLRLIFPKLWELLALGADLVALVKPQFEAGRQEISRGGKVKDEEVHQRVLQEVSKAGTELGFLRINSCLSPVKGKKSSNTEFFLHLKKPNK